MTDTHTCANCAVMVDVAVVLEKSVLRRVCLLAADPNYFLGLPDALVERGVVDAVHWRDTPALFSWLCELLSFQGISDAAAVTFMNVHGRAEWADVVRGLTEVPSCPKLNSHWHFRRCDFTRTRASCARPGDYARCPLPSLSLRNGNLNRMAFGLVLFIRDICDNDLVGWIDHQLEAVSEPHSPDYPERLGKAVIEPLRHVYGISDKVLNMALADLFISADPDRKLWVLAGSHMVAIDSLIHNLLHRTGTLQQLGAEHAYGPRCYGTHGCASIVRALACEIDASTFDASFPKTFPRFVQHALWRYCAQDGLNVCNGNQIADAARCENGSCKLFEACARLPLRPTIASKAAQTATL